MEENIFKKLGQPPKEVPSDLKQKVMEDVSAFHFFSEVLGLFTANYGEAMESFFKKRRPREK